MEREKAIKVGAAGVLGLVAVIILAMSLFGGGSDRPTDAEIEEVMSQVPPEGAGGGARLAPGAPED